MQEVRKQSTIVKHGISEFFRAYRLATVSNRDVVSNSIVLDYYRMIDRDVSDPLLKVADRIATSSHNLSDQTVCCFHRFSWLIHEVSLFALPLICEATSLLFI